MAQARKDLDLMSDAIAIVTHVLDDVEDQGDPMDVDSGKDQKPKYVPCLYLVCSQSTRFLSTHPSVLGVTLDWSDMLAEINPSDILV